MRAMQQLLLAVLIVALPAGAHAGLTGVSVGAGIWNHDPRGHVESEGDRADVEDALQIGSERGFFVWADLRHAVPVLPRLKFQYTPLRLTGSGTTSRNFRFAGVTFDGETNVGSEIELDQTDMILYWSPWRLVADIDVGVNVKYLDGLVEVEDRDSGERARVSFSGPLPMLYGRTEVRLPGTGFFGGGEASLLAYDGHRILDLTLRLGYRAGYGVGSLALEGGWKHQSIRLDDFDDLDADITVEGPYLGVAARF